MKKVFLKYLAEKIDELLTKVDEQMATKTDLAEKVDKVDGKGLSTNDYSTAEKNKLASIQEGAQKNTVTSVRGALELYPQVGDVVISAGSIGLGDANTRLTALENDKLDKSEKGATNGVASLDENGRVPSSQLPSYVDDVIDDFNFAQFPATGETGKIYIAKDTNKTYRWSGSGYAEISASLALGETEQTAYSGAKGKKNATDIAALQSTKASKEEAQGYAATAESSANDYTDGAVEDLAKGQVATNKANIATHTQQIADLDSNKLGKTEKAVDSAKADSAAALSVKTSTVTSVTNAALTYHLVLAANAGSLPHGDNANALISIPTLAGNLKYLHQLGFTGKGLFYRKFYNKDVDTTTPWSQIAFTDSTVANAINATQLGGVGADGYTRVLKGITTTANNHLYIGTLPASSSATRDSISIRGTIGGFGGDRDFVDIAIGRRNGLWFKGLSTFRYTGTSSYWDIVVNDAGEVYVLLYTPYCAYHIEVSSQEVTIYGVHGRTPTDTNWRYLSEELQPFDVITSDTFIGPLQGNADSATKLATPRTIWGQSFDGSGDVDGDITLRNNVHIYMIDASGNSRSVIYYATSDILNIGYGSSSASHSTYINGQTLRFRVSPAHTIAMEILANGNVGIGTTNPTEKLEVTGNIKASGMLTTGSDAQVGGAIDVEGGITSRGDIDASGNNILGNLNGTISMSTATSGTVLHIVGVQQTTSGKSSPFITPITITDDDMAVGGNVVITGTMTAAATYHSSDERLKTFEGDVDVDLEKLKALPKKYFHWTADADGKRQLGTSAQAVEEIFPELVSTNVNGHKSVNYANLSVVALAAVDKLAEQNAELAEQNAELKRRLAKIEKLLNIE